MSKDHPVTELIESWQQGNDVALDKLSSIVYNELQRKKRGSGIKPVTLHESVVHDGESPLDLLDLNRALDSLAKFDSRKADILELQYFAGLSAKEIAVSIGVSSRTVEREAQLAKAWVHRELSSV